MAADPPNDSIKCDEISKIASEACTRSGAFALLVSVLLFVLCAYWQGKKADEALNGYISHRLNLAMFFEELQNDEIWKKYLESDPDASQKPVAQLVDAKAVITQPLKNELLNQPDAKTGSGLNSILKPNPPAEISSPQKGHHPKPVRPLPPLAPPTLSATSVSIIELHQMPFIVDAWKKLNDSDLLTRSRGTSNYFDFSIAKWANRRGSLMYANVVAGVCKASELEVPYHFFKPERYVPRLNDEALMNCITFQNLKELSSLELPPPSRQLLVSGKYCVL